MVVASPAAALAAPVLLVAPVAAPVAADVVPAALAAKYRSRCAFGFYYVSNSF